MTTVQQFGEQLKREIQRIHTSVAFGLHEKIVNGTPIDTGRAKSSWNLSENEPDASQTPPLQASENDKQMKFLDVGAGSGQDLSDSQALVAAQSSQQNVGDTASVIYIANSLDYIEGLEHGNSKQAPEGMVMVNTTTDEIQLLIDQAIADKTPF